MNSVAMNIVVKKRKGGDKWFLRQRLGGTLWRKTLGDVDSMTRDEAEQVARKMVAACGQTCVELPATDMTTGVNCVSDDAVTLQQLWNRYLVVHAKPHKKSWRQDEYLFDKYISPVGGVAASDFDLALFHAGMSDTPVLANHVANVITRMYKVSRLDVPRFKKFKEKSRERFLTTEEVGRLLAAAEKRGGTICDFIKLCLYTAVRSGNVRTMQWSEVDFDARVWTIPADKAKSGKSIRVHLTDKAMAVLRARHAARCEGTDYVFPQRVGGVVRDAPIVQPRSRWLKVRDDAGLHDVTIHDLRRTVGSHLAMQGASMAVIAKCLGHSDLKSTAIYARLSPSAGDAAVEQVVAGF